MKHTLELSESQLLKLVELNSVDISEYKAKVEELNQQIHDLESVNKNYLSLITNTKGSTKTRISLFGTPITEVNDFKARAAIYSFYQNNKNEFADAKNIINYYEEQNGTLSDDTKRTNKFKVQIALAGMYKLGIAERILKENVKGVEYNYRLKNKE